MKQGSATSSRMGATKPDTLTTQVNPGYASQIGQAIGPARAIEPMIMGKGVQAPPMTVTSHHTGSQGKR